MSGAGDVNGDGFADLIIGADGADPNGLDSGASYVVFGKTGGLSSVDLSALNGSNGFRINGVAADDRSGGSVSSAGDINGDGKPDGFNPAWQCWNLRGGYQHKSGLTANLAIENLLDLHYRYFASGMSASGRSVNLSVAYQF